MSAAKKATQQPSLGFESIKQYPGLQQVDRAVKVLVPGKHFPQLTSAEQNVYYEGTAVEHGLRHPFGLHRKAWGAAHTGEGIRFVCIADAIDDPDNKGHWTTLKLWNSWRHTTYKDRRNEELQYLDDLPATAGMVPASQLPVKKVEPEVKRYFDIVSTGTHTFGGTGPMRGKSSPFYNYACKEPGCARGPTRPIKQVAAATGQLFLHLATCQPVLCQRLRANSKFSPVCIDADGTEYSLYSFKELLPHHVRYVEKCFRGFQHFYETRSNTGLLEYIQGYDQRASLLCSMVKVPRASIAYSAPVPPQRAPGGSVQLGTPGVSPGQWDPTHGLSYSS